MARIGIYGGSFDPPHNGHIAAAKNAQDALSLDKLLLIPTAEPPHKTLSSGSPGAEHRLAMLRLAARAIPNSEVLDIEISRGGKSYTVDTLRTLRAKYPQDELFLLMGTDMLLSFFSWREPEQILKLAAVVCFRRQTPDEKQQKAMQQQADRIAQAGGRCILLQNPVLELSSTTVRRMLFFGCADPFLPGPVLDHILQNGLYCTKDDCKNLSYDALKRYSLRLHDEKRVAHAIGTSEFSGELAGRFGADRELALRAGILHDITKALRPAQQLLLCEHLHAAITQEQRDNPKLLHAVTGAAAAEKIFGECSQIVDAIGSHTTGAENMTVLQKILYIADYAEPNRDFPGVEELRQALTRSLDEAVMLGLSMTMQQLTEKGAVICRDTLAAYDSLKKERNRDPSIHETLRK